MIVFGTNHFKISKEPLLVNVADNPAPVVSPYGTATETPAPEPQHLPVDVYQKYFHLFWIPVVPIGKLVGFKEKGKLYTLKEDKLSGKERDAIREFSHLHKSPWYSFAGALMVGVLVVFSMISGAVDPSSTDDSYSSVSSIDTPAETDYANPAVGDILIFKNLGGKPENKTYFVGRVQAITGDSVFVRMGTTLEYNVTLYGQKATTEDDPSASQLDDYIRKEIITDKTLFEDSEDAFDLPFSKAELSEERKSGKLLHTYRE